MQHSIHSFTYDGTLEGLLSVYIRCISMKVKPLDIKPDLMVTGKPFEERYMFVRTNPGLADRLYRYMGECASVQIQQMILDCFLTSLPNMEIDLYDLICRSIRFGARVAEDYEDVTMHRIQMAIRDLYRESQTIAGSADFKDEQGVSVLEINPRNRVLPLIRHKILNDPKYDDLLAYDRRHGLLLLRTGSEDELLDIRRLPIPSVRGSHEIYDVFWPYVKTGRSVPCGSVRRGFGHGSDGLDPLWRIA